MGCNFMKQFLHHSKTCSTGTVPVKILLLNDACNRTTQTQLFAVNEYSYKNAAVDVILDRVS